ncbi:MAG: hypothetical protein ACK5MZ_06765 [Aestuariibaculum sp.]
MSSAVIKNGSRIKAVADLEAKTFSLARTLAKTVYQPLTYEKKAVENRFGG